MALAERMRAVVTGGGGGLGRAFCVEIARRGGRVIIGELPSVREGAEQTARLVRDAGGRADVAVCDVSRAEEVRALADRADDVMGGCDLLVNNAGVAVAGAVGAVPLENWKWILDINLWGVIYGCHEFIPRMRARGAGHVINVASAAGLLSPATLGPYNVTKAGVIALSETLSAELQGTGVGVTVLCPTFFKTGISEHGRGQDERSKRVIEKLMERSKLQAPEVAAAALDAAGANRLYAVPMGDGRWMWRIKRAVPEKFVKMAPRLLDRLVQTLDRG